MTYEEELAFLASVQTFCNTPEKMHQVILRATIGIANQNAKVRAHAVDMETVASVSLNARMYKGSKKFIANLLEKHSGMNALKWDDQIKELRK